MAKKQKQKQKQQRHYLFEVLAKPNWGLNHNLQQNGASPLPLPTHCSGKLIYVVYISGKLLYVVYIRLRFQLVPDFSMNTVTVL